MFNVQSYPEAKQQELRDIAERALGAMGVGRLVDTPAVEQLWRLS